MIADRIMIVLITLAGLYFPARAILFWGWGI
mgnify:FL=1